MHLLTTTAVFASSLGLISGSYLSHPDARDLHVRDLYDAPDIYARDAYDDFGAPELYARDEYDANELYARDEYDANELYARDADYDEASFPESDGLLTRSPQGGMPMAGSCMSCHMTFVRFTFPSPPRSATHAPTQERNGVRIRALAAKIAAKRRMRRLQAQMMPGSAGASSAGKLKSEGAGGSSSGAHGASGALGRRAAEVIPGAMGETMGGGKLMATSKMTATKKPHQFSKKKLMAKNKAQLDRCLKKCEGGAAAGGASKGAMGAEGNGKTGGSSKVE